MLKLNNKGQSLVLFIMIIPILLLIMVFVYDMGMLLYEKDRLSNIVNMAIDYGLDNKEVSDEEIRELINKNTDREVEVKIEKSGFLLLILSLFLTTKGSCTRFSFIHSYEARIPEEIYSTC